jgi:hypothetical protein
MVTTLNPAGAVGAGLAGDVSGSTSPDPKSNPAACSRSTVSGSSSGWNLRASGLLLFSALSLPRMWGWPPTAVVEGFFRLKIMGKLPVGNEITMYHSDMKINGKTIGRASACNLVLDHDSVSRVHANIEVSKEGYLTVQDAHSSNGTFLHRNGRWIRTRKVILGTRDRIRFGDHEVPLDRLVELFGDHSRVRLREGYSVRGKPLLFDDMIADLPKPKIVLENPRRNPLTGDIEENK